MKTALRNAALATALAVSLPVAPALAGGSLAINLAPSNGQEAALLRMGLAAYALRNDIRTNGHVTQRGVRNAAGLSQGGRNNQGLIHQEGRGHTGTLTQTGGNNAYGLFQFGRGTEAHVGQTGGQTGMTILYGW